MPEVMGKVLFPLCQWSDQSNRQNAKRIRINDNNGTSLSHLSAESGIEAY